MYMQLFKIVAWPDHKKVHSCSITIDLGVKPTFLLAVCLMKVEDGEELEGVLRTMAGLGMGDPGTRSEKIKQAHDDVAINKKYI